VRALREEPAEALRPARPPLVELAAAILLVGGAMDIVMALLALGQTVPTPQARTAATIAIAIGLVLVALGALIRRGQAWLLAINVVAVLAFLEVASATPTGLVFAALDVIFVALLLRARWWFQWTPPEAA
jgi:hypothetical protein